MFHWREGQVAAMMSGVEFTSIILTSCQTYSVRFKPVVLCSSIVLPCRSGPKCKPLPPNPLQVPEPQDNVSLTSNFTFLYHLGIG